MEREVTIRDLLTHTSCLSYGNAEDSLVDDMYREAALSSPILRLQVSLEELAQKLSELPLAHQPGSQWRYSLATDVIGYLVGLISCVPFDMYVEEKILKPLGMDDTAFYIPPKKINRLAAIYGRAQNYQRPIAFAAQTAKATSQEITTYVTNS